MADTVSYRPKAGEIPTQPGVYRFKDASGRVLYVGKAKNLRARLSNYFAPLRSLHERTRRMVTTAAGVEWTVVGTDIESLQLEYTWIKEFNPPFNVKFRDDKTYPFLAVTLGDEAPRVMVTRNHRIKGAKYFGPYPKIWAVRDTIDLMIKAFPIRTCSDSSYKQAMQTGRPCFPGQIGRCGGPCSQKVTIEEHRARVDDFVAFLEGGDKRFVTAATKGMREAAERQDYESAAMFRDRLQALEAVLAKSAVVLRDSADTDLFAIEHDELAASVQQFIVRGGRIRGERSWTVDKEIDVDTGELVDSILLQAYDDEVPPREIIVPALPDDSDELAAWLGGRRPKQGRVILRTAQRGEKAALMETASMNAKNNLMLYKTRRSADFVARSQALTDIQEALGMTDAPLRMECFDVSHLSGTNIVASMVVFEDGLARKDQYRRFSIADSTDDTESIYQVITRRLAYLKTDPEREAADAAAAAEQIFSDGEGPVEPTKRKKFSYPPNLLIVDGGQPQVNAAARALEESGVQGIFLAGIAKRLEEVWLPQSDYPVILPRGSEALFMIQRIRDEAHRFAITHQRSRRKRDITSVLTEVPGLGPARVRELLRHFGSVSELKKADVEAIAAVKGIGPQLAGTIRSTLAG
ncbi:excinuclease ABC subunit UvrC [Herbiconiux sp. KACC 21604]|uniref:excinuclease ABC subunit UvrC n=1 Tax=unclassified Herbiconiux TaxID=2618217 RepID=UPI00149244EC|nr:excinuclease ABC subunit UvrC [Herbiconiux sp. SALV-R1]QJU53564.1 excinuclease ABC subunit UvrC [Herbiconiux sp. SALV-R1]WPO88545.1 excinuclease ABC subunit UvrC [Herbiconiux sp. KACC 21604]